MKFTKSVLAISVALAVSGVADAATKQKDDDSVREWGRWAVLMPAAGPDAGPGFAIPAGKDLGSCESSENCPTVVVAAVPEEPPVVPPVIPPDEPPAGHCAAGAACGYATYEYSNYYEESHGARVPANIDLEVEFAPDYDLPAGQQNTGTSSDFTITPITPNDDPLANYPPVVGQHPEGYHYYNSGDGSLYWETNSDTAPDGGEGSTRTWSYINGGMMPAVTEDTTAGWWNEGEGYSYYCDGGYYCGGDTLRQSQGNYVAGTATDNLNAGNVAAVYNGFAMDNNTPVTINIDFGASTWSGTWNGGRDGTIDHVDTDENGVRHVDGQVGFRASGHLIEVEPNKIGPNIVSDAVSADDGQVTGSVDGSFFGSQAQVLGGVSDITKTVAGEGGYTNARNVDVFVTVKDALVEQVDDTFRRRPE